MKTILPFLMLISSPFLWGQSRLEAYITRQQAEIPAKIAFSQNYLSTLTQTLGIAERNVKEKEEQLQFLQAYVDDFESSRSDQKEKIKRDLRSRINRVSNSERRIYDCLMASIESDQYTFDRCFSVASIGINTIRLLNEKLEILTLNPTQITSKIQSFPEELEILKRDFKAIQARIDVNKKDAAELQSRNQMNQKILSEISANPSLASMALCNAGTPEINLEEQTPYPGASFTGPFYGVARDNQDGVGSCYANAAKNYLVGISKGEDVASFLDIALHFKAKSGSLTNNLDGGYSCHALEAVKEVGYCPQSYSFIETGEENEFTAGLFRERQGAGMGERLELIKKFVSTTEILDAGADPLTENIKARAKPIIEALVRDRNIDLPLPIANVHIPEMWKLREQFNFARPRRGDILEADFLRNYASVYNRSFYPKYVKAILDKKSKEQIFAIYSEAMTPFLTQMEMNHLLPQFKSNFHAQMADKIQDAGLQTKLKASIQFLREVMSRPESSIEELISFCQEEALPSFKFLSSMGPIIKEMREGRIDGEYLFDGDGKFKSTKELMQLLIAPKCLNLAHRKPLPGFHCQNEKTTMDAFRGVFQTEAEKNKMLREKIILSLLKGQPLGNTFSTGQLTAHINTIVGYRFDRIKNECQLRIRESQNGTSAWHSESSILNRMTLLTEVRPE